jgi:hypothetical protein
MKAARHIAGQLAREVEPATIGNTKADTTNHDGRAFARPSRSQRCYPLLGSQNLICHMARRW